MKVVIKFFTLFIVLFVVTQIPLTLWQNRNEELAFPSMSFSKLIDGSYSLELENYYTENSYIAKVTSTNYRDVIYKLFSRSNDNVIEGKKDFLFLKSSSDEVSPKQFEDIPRIVEYIKNVNELLKENGVNLMVLLLPSRSFIYPDYAYKTKKVPQSRLDFFNQIYE